MPQDLRTGFVPVRDAPDCDYGTIRLLAWAPQAFSEFNKHENRHIRLWPRKAIYVQRRVSTYHLGPVEVIYDDGSGIYVGNRRKFHPHIRNAISAAVEQTRRIAGRK